MTALVPCPVCKARVGLRPDVTMKRHAAVFSRRDMQCPGTGASPACGFCQRPAKHATLAVDVFVCDACHAAVQRRDRVRRCEAKGCKSGRVRCDEHMATAEERDEGQCDNCGGRDEFDDAVTCAECHGRGVIYVSREEE